MKKHICSHSFMIVLSLALLVCFTGCAPSSPAEDGNSVLSSENLDEEGTALFQLDPEDIEYIRFSDEKGYPVFQGEKKKDIEKIVTAFNDFRYQSTVEIPVDPKLREDIRSYPFECAVAFQDTQGRCYACEFARCGEIRLRNTPVVGTMTVYISDQAGCFDDVIPYLFK